MDSELNKVFSIFLHKGFFLFVCLFYDMMIMQSKIQLPFLFYTLTFWIMEEQGLFLVLGSSSLNQNTVILSAAQFWKDFKGQGSYACSSPGSLCRECREKGEMIKITDWFFAAPCWTNTCSELCFFSLTVIKIKGY